MQDEVRKIEKYVQIPHVYGVDISFRKYGVFRKDPKFEIYVREEGEGIRKMLERRVLRRSIVSDENRIFENAKKATIGENKVKVLDLSDLVIQILGQDRPLPALVSSIPVSLALHPQSIDPRHVISVTQDKSFIQKLGLLFEIADYLNPDPDVKRKLRILRRFYPFQDSVWILNPPPSESSEKDEETRSKNRILTIQSFWKCFQTPLMEEFEAQFRLHVPEERMKWRYQQRITKKFSERGIRVRKL